MNRPQLRGFADYCRDSHDKIFICFLCAYNCSCILICFCVLAFIQMKLWYRFVDCCMVVHYCMLKSKLLWMPIYTHMYAIHIVRIRMKGKYIMPQRQDTHNLARCATILSCDCSGCSCRGQQHSGGLHLSVSGETLFPPSLLCISCMIT